MLLSPVLRDEVGKQLYDHPLLTRSELPEQPEQLRFHFGAHSAPTLLAATCFRIHVAAPPLLRSARPCSCIRRAFSRPSISPVCLTPFHPQMCPSLMRLYASHQGLLLHRLPCC